MPPEKPDTRQVPARPVSAQGLARNAEQFGGVLGIQHPPAIDPLRLHPDTPSITHARHDGITMFVMRDLVQATKQQSIIPIGQLEIDIQCTGIGVNQAEA